MEVSIPQSGFGAFEREGVAVSVAKAECVSIPQSGFGAFERIGMRTARRARRVFQSLSRDSGRLNPAKRNFGARRWAVSIPQSGFGAFERRSLFHLQLQCQLRFNPSVGIRGV